MLNNGLNNYVGKFNQWLSTKYILIIVIIFKITEVLIIKYITISTVPCSGNVCSCSCGDK